ncbi:hypothetical protein E2C01_012108 [Portunus trituberculatus]|uniref:Uncharacterized protein n=1 Tax=Portunus trituberculatus TaxID=210409 RepID=A0A5B7DD98_PORTR|nr:hypothetical protein [Portunus trituberculatus]
MVLKGLRAREPSRELIEHSTCMPLHRPACNSRLQLPPATPTRSPSRLDLCSLCGVRFIYRCSDSALTVAANR